MKNLIVRSLSGAVYVALIIASILYGPWTFVLLMGLFVILGMAEYEKMINERSDGEGLSRSAYCLDILMAFFIWASWPLGYFSIGIGFYFVLFLLLILLSLRFFVSIFDKSGFAVSNISRSFLGILYIALPLTLLSLLNTVIFGRAKYFLLFTFILIWLNDTGAFLVGSKFGKRRLCERLSPKKSWEGFWGGFAFCVIAGIIYGICFNHSIVWVAVYGAVVSVFATVGDLFESMLKRSAGVKDSGKLIPGHGGILDRIDSLLFVSIPAFIMYFISTAIVL